MSVFNHSDSFMPDIVLYIGRTDVNIEEAMDLETR